MSGLPFYRTTASIQTKKKLEEKRASGKKFDFFSDLNFFPFNFFPFFQQLFLFPSSSSFPKEIKLVFGCTLTTYLRLPGLFPKTSLIVYLLQLEPAILIPGGMLRCAPCNQSSLIKTVLDNLTTNQKLPFQTLSCNLSRNNKFQITVFFAKD